MRASTVFSSSLSTPNFFAYAGTIIEYMAAAVSVRTVPSFGGWMPVRPWRPLSFTFSTPTVMATS